MDSHMSVIQPRGQELRLSNCFKGGTNTRVVSHYFVKVSFVIPRQKIAEYDEVLPTRSQGNCEVDRFRPHTLQR